MTRCPYCGKEIPAEEEEIPELKKITLPKIPEIEARVTGIRCPWCGQLFDAKEFAEHHAKCPSRPKPQAPKEEEETE
jgi:sarcosine oxidase delta subunit